MRSLSLLFILFFTSVAHAAPLVNYSKDFVPEMNDRYDLGTTTPALEWNRVYTKDLYISGTCTGCGAATAATFGTTSISAAYPLNWNTSTAQLTTVATSSLNLTTSSFLSQNISQWTNNSGYLTSLAGAASSTLLADKNTWTNIQTMSISGNAGTVTNGVYTTTFNNLFDNRLSASTSIASVVTLSGLSITKSQVSDFGSYESPLTFNYPLTRSVNAISFPATSTLYGTGTGGQVLMWSNGAPLWAATSSAAGGGVTSVTGTWPISSSGGNTPNITWAGLATTSQPSTSNLLVSNGGSGVYGVATSTLTATGPLTGSFTQLGSGSLGCTTAASGVAGCLSNTSFDIFNNKQAPGFQVSTTSSLGISKLAYFTSVTGTTFGGVATTSETCTWPQICSAHDVLTGGGAITFGGLSTSSAISAASGLLYATGVNTLASVSTSSAVSMSVTGNAGTVTTNANLSGVVTSSGNTTSYGSQSAGVLGNSVTGNTGVMATSTLFGAGFSINSSGKTSFGTTTTTGILNIGSNTGAAGASTTIFMAKLQFDGYNAANVRSCAFIVGTAWVVAAGACK